ncbi:Hypothetical protein PACV_315 [Pacmanvirus A23]|uniref:Hypothetical protein n=1 Tax=Pacmanvirus A23 TaxID=1932881 RepID=UPI000A09613D|nr:Hypothetical protein B9W72_gp311 [Pacmanvirus A23]SIP86028.1 Hypothetical protein PACV_315 [Pacmanvirus A23]
MSGYSTGDKDLKIHIQNEKNVTIDEIVAEANHIWQMVRKRKIPFGNIDAAEALMSEIRKTNPEFSKSYPIVLRYMCQMDEYDSRALKKYLIKIEKHPWKNEVEYLDSQTDYVVLLYQIKHPRWNKTDVNNLRRNVRNLLQREHVAFKTYAEEFNKEVNAEEEIFKSRRVEELRNFVQKAGESGISSAETIRVETDLNSSKIDLDYLLNVKADKPSGVSADSLLMD